MNTISRIVTLSSLLTILLSCNSDDKKNARTLSASAFAQQLQQTTDPLLIDVRSPEEFASGHLDAAVNINIDGPDFREQLAKINPKQPVFVYCKGGGRSAAATAIMQEMGFKTIYELKGGIMSWENKHQETVSNTITDDATSVADYEKIVATHPLLIVDFNAPWCGPCKKMKPDFELLEQQYAGTISFVAINVDEAKELSMKEQIEGIPLIVVYKGGKEIKRVMGYQTREQLEDLVQLLQ